MPPLIHKFKRLTIVCLFLISFILCTWSAHFLSAHKNVAIAQTPTEVISTPQSADALMQQGVDNYHSGDFRAAIAAWELALKQYETDGGLEYQATAAENLARAYRQLGDINLALNHWEQAIQLYHRLEDQQKVGRLLTEQAQTYLSLGQYRQGFSLLCNAELSKPKSELDRLPLSRAPAIPELECLSTTALGIARGIEPEDSLGEAAALGTLGEAYRAKGDYDAAISVLRDSVEIAEDLDNSAYLTSAYEILGRVYARKTQISERRIEEAPTGAAVGSIRQDAEVSNRESIMHFERSLETAKDASSINGQLKAIEGLIRAFHRSKNGAKVQELYDQALVLLCQLSSSRSKVYTAIRLASLQPLANDSEAIQGSLSEVTCFSRDAESLLDTEPLLQLAVSIADEIHDYRAQSFAFGNLGHFYESRGEYEKALAQTQKAEVAADKALIDQGAESFDSLYLWQWQTGRILNKRGELKKAIAAYDESIKTLERIRDDILNTDRDIQFDFRDSVEPVYRQLIELRLGKTPDSTLIPSETNDSENLKAALRTVDSLRLAELQNYFGDECIILASIDSEDDTQAIDDSREKTGIFSTFILKDRTAVILSLPDGQRKVEWLDMDQERIITLVTQFRENLESSWRNTDDYDRMLGQQLYEKLISPFQADLEQADVQTLVFLQDGVFRSIPMAALYDGEAYLIEQYAISTVPSLSSIAQETISRRRNPRVLALGMSKASTTGGIDFPDLPGVERELTQIELEFSGSQTLLNEAFTLDNLKRFLQDESYSIIHVATHGQFGARPEDTFLVTGNSEKLTIGDLDLAIRDAESTSQVELLTLTACETGVGDKRSTLGLAGVAVQAGVRSAIASLWSIDDGFTPQLVKRFYKELNSLEVTKAEALRKAQLSFISDNENSIDPENSDANRGGFVPHEPPQAGPEHPYFWAPFILIGNGL